MKTLVVVMDTDGGRVELLPSSAVQAGETEGPFVWLTVKMRDGRMAFVRLTEEQANQIAVALKSRFAARPGAAMSEAAPRPLVERLARDAVREMHEDHCVGVGDTMIPVVYSPMFQPIADALRAALREAGALVREHDPWRHAPSSDSNVNVHFSAHIEEIAAAIEALAG